MVLARVKIRLNGDIKMLNCMQGVGKRRLAALVSLFGMNIVYQVL